MLGSTFHRNWVIYFQINSDLMQSCYSKGDSQSAVLTYEKCRLSGPISGLLSRNLSFNKIKSFIGALKLGKSTAQPAKVSYLMEILLEFGKPNLSGMWRVRMSLLKCYYLKNSTLFQFCYGSEYWQEHLLQKPKRLTDSSGSSEQFGALTVDWNFVCDCGLSK